MAIVKSPKLGFFPRQFNSRLPSESILHWNPPPHFLINNYPDYSTRKIPNGHPDLHHLLPHAPTPHHRTAWSWQPGILADGHILNVALTRARRGLVVLGDSATCLGSEAPKRARPRKKG